MVLWHDQLYHNVGLSVFSHLFKKKFFYNLFLLNSIFHIILTIASAAAKERRPADSFCR